VKAPARITLLTDFGAADGYAGAVRGVIAARAPAVRVDDAGHDVPRGDIAAAAAALARYWREYPEGTVHVVVVDPGVGGARAALLVMADGRFGVGPDNGVLTPMLDSPGFESVRVVRNADLFRHPVSATFHGRDVFAPVAAYVAQGGLPGKVGPEAAVPVRLARTEPERTATGSRGVILHADRFGNLATNLPADLVRHAVDVRVGDRSVGPLRATYAAVAPGTPLALIGSDGFLEIAVRDGSAAALPGFGAGITVTVRLAGND
jgi:hypothetical protein